MSKKESNKKESNDNGESTEDKKDKNSESTEDKKEKFSLNVNVEELGKAGLHFGHSVANRHPNMKPYIGGVKGEVHIFDLNKTAEKLEQAMKFLSEQKKEGKNILIVGTKPQTKQMVQETAKKHNLPFMTYRWVGGLITNFNEIKKRIDHLNDLLEKRESGELDKYTKKEQLEIDREIEKLENKFGGVREMTSLPDVIFALNMDKDEIAIKEAAQKDVPVVAVCDTNTDPMRVDYPIPANDDSIASIELILEKFDKAIS